MKTEKLGRMKLKRAIIVQPLGLPTLEKEQKLGERLLQGKNGFYFLKKIKNRVYEAEYFGVRDLKNKEIHMTLKDSIKLLNEELNKEI